MKTYGPKFLAAVAFMLLAASSDGGAATTARAAHAERMRHLAGELGCTVCHRDPSPTQAADPATPLAPSWHEIATRYRGQPGAEARLMRIVTQGSDTRHSHWRDRLEFATMEGNARRVSPDEARALVRWILSSQ
jgi:cytochrome c551/c552